MSNKFEQIIYQKVERVAKITLNRPEKLNALTPKMEEELRAAFTECQQDDDIRVLIITGAGRGFCSGEDIEVLLEMQKKPPADPGKPIPTPAPSSPACRDLLDIVEKPVIAAVNGPCAGQGNGLALSCDIRIGSENARFAHVYPARALVASAESWFLPRIIGLGPAIYYTLSTEEINAQEALRLNLISKLVPADRLDDEVMALANKIASFSPSAVKFSKKAIYQGLMQDFDAAMQFVGYARALTKGTGETARSSAAFLEEKKRKR